MKKFRIIQNWISYSLLCRILSYICKGIVMNGLKELFQMSRRERRGTIVILALIAVLLAGTLAVRSCGTHRPGLVQEGVIEQFEADADSVTLSVDKADKKQSHRKKGRKRRPSPQKPRPDKTPRRLDPVPQF